MTTLLLTEPVALEIPGCLDLLWMSFITFCSTYNSNTKQI